MPPSTGSELIHAERIRQIEAEDFDFEHDDEHTDGELIGAAIVYALTVKNGDKEPHRVIPPMTFWPYQWDERWCRRFDDPIRMLVKAGALLAAEIDRLQRIEDAT